MRVALLFVFAVAACGSAPPKPATRVLHTKGLAPWAGRWKVESFAFANATTDEAGARAKVGQVAVIGEGSIDFADLACEPRSITTASSFAEDYLARKFNTTLAAVRVTDASLTVVQTGCAGAFNEFFQTHEGEIVISADGVLYFLHKAE